MNNEETQDPIISGKNRQNAEGLLKTYVYSTVNQFCERHPAFTKGGMRFSIFNEETNGLAESGAIVRMGRKVLINEPKFFQWLESQNQAA